MLFITSVRLVPHTDGKGSSAGGEDEDGDGEQSVEALRQQVADLGLKCVLVEKSHCSILNPSLYLRPMPPCHFLVFCILACI
jgi:hypothetical protein